MSSEKKRSAKTGKCSNSNGRDITQLVDTYHHLLDKLYPAFAVWDAVLYVTRYVYVLPALAPVPQDFLSRWENYLLTLATILILSLFLYFPCELLSTSH